MVTSAAAAAACMAVAVCATAAPDPGMPHQLPAAQRAQLAGICQNVLGLQPSERPSTGTWLPDAHLAPVTSHYQGCIASLADSLQQAATATNAQRADTDCRARGLASGSPALALCVLRAEQEPGAQAIPRSSQLAAPVASQGAQGAQKATLPVGSFFYASAHETARREQQACASLGFEPPYGQFASCVKRLQDTFFAIDNPVE